MKQCKNFVQPPVASLIHSFYIWPKWNNKIKKRLDDSKMTKPFLIKDNPPPKMIALPEIIFTIKCILN